MKRVPLIDYDTFPHAWVTPRELAAFVECDTRTILRMIECGKVDACRAGRRWRIDISAARRAFPRQPVSRETA